MKKSFLLLKVSIISLIFTACNPAPQRLANQFIAEPQITECPEGQILNTEINECTEDATDGLSLRPDQAIDVVTACACRSGESLSFGTNCESFCANRSNEEALLFIELNPGPEIALNDSLITVRNWCNVDIDDSGVVPVCRMDVVDVNNNLVGTVQQTSDSLQTEVTGLNIFNNTLTLNLSRVNIQLNQSYFLRFQEETSGARWTSDIQVSLSEPAGDGFNFGLLPLTPLPVNQYSCIVRRGGSNGQGDQNFLVQDPFFYYFTFQQMPSAVPGGIDNVICHDSQSNPIDSIELPRLNQITGAFNVWNANDPRFADERDVTGEFQSNGVLDIEDLIQFRLNQRGITGAPNQFFSPLQNVNHFPNSLISQFAGAQTTEEDTFSPGFILNPFIDRSTPVNGTFLSFCPNGENFNSNVVEQQILGDILGNETEGLYVARSEPVLQTLDDNETILSPPSILYIPQGVLERIWFFINSNGQRERILDNRNAVNRTLHFYWPRKPNDIEPTIRAQGQRLFTILIPEAANNGLRTHDGRIGCIPQGSL